MSGIVDILLATYNGASFLPEQLDSLLAQTCHDWRLLVRDDGSSDRTREILECYRSRHPDRIAVMPNEEQTLGASANFGLLLERADAPYIMFCDQDDVWLPDKIETTLAAMRELERRYGAETPLFVHTDLVVVDERLSRLGDSLWRFQCIDPRRLSRLNRALMQNFATGCTVMINRALRALALPIPVEAIMYDWWLSLVAAAFGQVDAVGTPTVLYRQHEQNEIGAARWSSPAGVRSFLVRERRRAAVSLFHAALARQEQQAAAFLHRFEERLPRAKRRMLRAFCSLSGRSFIMRRYQTFMHRFFYSNVQRNLGLMLLR